MTGINAVGRSISRKGVMTVFGSTKTTWYDVMLSSNAIVGTEIDIKGSDEEREKQETGNKAHMFVKLTANNLFTRIVTRNSHDVWFHSNEVLAMSCTKAGLRQKCQDMQPLRSFETPD
jgi:hypothetical protein